ncbi:MAG: hypothetical protein KF911_12075 [Pseudomonadales bacterium]|nr:hypothetical protein [Pseudomonadales bacterium]
MFLTLARRMAESVAQPYQMIDGLTDPRVEQFIDAQTLDCREIVCLADVRDGLARSQDRATGYAQ